jgi:uridine kinase
MNRSELLEAIADTIHVMHCAHPVRVAVDGIDASGKTTLADELVQPLQARGREVIRASVDRFHLPQAVRHQRGSLSPEGYYHDSFDYDALKADLLEPLGVGGSRRYRTEKFDYRVERRIESEWQTADEHAVLIVDGVFLQRPEINAYWDLRIWVDVPFEVVLQRAYQRDVELFGSVEVVRERYEKRYIPGQKLYFAQCQPKASAQLVVDNRDPLHPLLFQSGTQKLSSKQLT